MFHSLVGLAAVTTSLGSFMSLEHHSMLHGVASYFGVFIGGKKKNHLKFNKLLN